MFASVLIRKTKIKKHEFKIIFKIIGNIVRDQQDTEINYEYSNRLMYSCQHLSLFWARKKIVKFYHLKLQLSANQKRQFLLNLSRSKKAEDVSSYDFKFLIPCLLNILYWLRSIDTMLHNNFCYQNFQLSKCSVPAHQICYQAFHKQLLVHFTGKLQPITNKITNSQQAVLLLELYCINSANSCFKKCTEIHACKKYQNTLSVQNQIELSKSNLSQYCIKSGNPILHQSKFSSYIYILL